MSNRLSVHLKVLRKVDFVKIIKLEDSRERREFRNGFAVHEKGSPLFSKRVSRSLGCSRGSLVSISANR